MDLVPQRRNSPVAAITVVAVVLLLLLPGASSQGLDEPGHDHDLSAPVAVDATHTSLPAHIEASASAFGRICSACLQGRTLVRLALDPGWDHLAPTATLSRAIAASNRGRPRQRRAPSRAPPKLV